MTIKLKLVPRSTMKAKTLTRFPARVVAGDGITITQDGLTYTFTINEEDFASILDPDLGALAANTDNGLWARTSSGAGAARTITGTTDEINVTNGDGVDGDPTIALAQFTNSGTGAQARTIRSRLADTIHAADFGVVTGASDQRARLQAALDAAEARGYACVLLPAGNVSVDVSTTPITVPANVRLMGHGMFGSAITALSFYANNFIILESGASISDMTVDGGDFDDDTVPNTVIGASQVNNITVERCYLNKIGNIGVGLNGVDGFTVEDCYIQRTTATGLFLNCAILTSTSLAVTNTNGIVAHNYFLNSGLEFSGSNIKVIGNTINGSQFGSNCAFDADAFTFENQYCNNLSMNASGTDYLGNVVDGGQFWGPRNIISNNISKSNASDGFYIGGQNTRVVGNVSVNNGNAGFTAAYFDATDNASGSVFADNFATNTTGTAQDYGYVEQNASLANIQLVGNRFTGNTIANTSILSSSTTLHVSANGSTGAVTVTSASASALTVGRQGATSPALKVDASAGSSATGISIIAGASGGGAGLRAITSGTNDSLFIDAAGSGFIQLGLVSTGAILLNRNTTVTGAIAADTAGGTMVATQSDQETGTSTTTLVSPGRQHFHPSAAKCWVQFNAAGTIGASYNTTSITDNGAGDWTVNIGTDFSGSAYSASAIGGFVSGVAALIYICIAQAAGTFRIQAARHDTAAAADPDTPNSIMFMAFGDQ